MKLKITFNFICGAQTSCQSRLLSTGRVRTALIQIQDGEYFSIYPFDVAAREVIYPFPKRDERRTITQ